ncbi:hypothetical protein RUM44_012765 [Polyplax serrata]|uniref:Uncharacterized protein n=1 Tax=Polyplax serrata TaxID=468196 RepID=A0ABR1BCA2_POLSC
MRDMKGIKPPTWSAGEPCHTYGKKEAMAGDITNSFKWIIAGGRTMKRLNRRNKLSLNFSEEKKRTRWLRSGFAGQNLALRPKLDSFRIALDPHNESCL